MAFTSLAYLIDIDWLKEAYRRTRKNGAVGVDGVTAEKYEQDLEGNLQSLLDQADWNTRRQILRTLIERVAIEPAQIRIVYRINFPLFAKRASTASKEKVLHFRWSSGFTPDFECIPALRAGPVVRAGREAANASVCLPHPLCG